MGMDSKFMKPVQNSIDEEEIESLLLQSINLEYSNSKYASASVFNNIRLRIESEDKRNQGDYSTTTTADRKQISDAHACEQSNGSAPQLGSTRTLPLCLWTLPLCLCDIAHRHNRIHGMWCLLVMEANS